ncbi:uncharacterized protein B0T15DRAFT_22717 [Chaetomium strumarium]|uniref:Uncharacterized protein n=1 Tax=Chaetomium strumarium TaxID=1170767 RepID=A0AAJ0H1E7_9PEZI|nr:hypothetical protein B0T15DRAFT_22717 [Chaetomium strumarium]
MYMSWHISWKERFYAANILDPFTQNDSGASRHAHSCESSSRLTIKAHSLGVATGSLTLRRPRHPDVPMSYLHLSRPSLQAQRTTHGRSGHNPQTDWVAISLAYPCSQTESSGRVTCIDRQWIRAGGGQHGSFVYRLACAASPVHHSLNANIGPDTVRISLLQQDLHVVYVGGSICAAAFPNGLSLLRYYALQVYMRGVRVITVAPCPVLYTMERSSYIVGDSFSMVFLQPTFPLPGT